MYFFNENGFKSGKLHEAQTNFSTTTRTLHVRSPLHKKTEFFQSKSWKQFNSLIFILQMAETQITMESDPSDPVVKANVNSNRSKFKSIWIFYVLSALGLCILVGFFIYKALNDYYFVCCGK